MYEKMKSSEILYLTPFDPLIHRRPIFAKLALPQIKLINYVKVWETSMGNVGRILNKTYYGIRKFERRFFSGRWSGDYLLGAYYYDFLNYFFLIKKLRPPALITLNTPLALGAKLLGGDAPLIVDLMDVWMPRGQMNQLDVKTVERADAVIFWSRPLMELVTRRLGIRRATYVPYGVNLKIFDPPRRGDREGVRKRFGIENKFLILYSGGLLRSKGMDLQGVRKALEAFALFSKKSKDSVLVLQIFNYDAQLLKDIKELGIKDRVVLIGKLPLSNDPMRQGLFSAADILVLPASHHPIIYYAERMKAFQYMAAANSIIAEKTPGAVSALGETALYVRLNDVEEMADAMLRLHGDQDLRAKLGTRARQRVESYYEWSMLIPNYRDFVLHVIG